MKKRNILAGWELMPAPNDKAAAVAAGFPENGPVFMELPDQVQAVLLRKGILYEGVAVGETDTCRWIENCDWEYTCTFSATPEKDGEKSFLFFEGLDLFADIFLNGKKIGSHDNMFLPKRVEVTGTLQQENLLKVVFASPRRKMEELEQKMPENWHGIVQPRVLLRKDSIDFGDVGKVIMLNVGLFGDVFLERTESCEIDWTDIEVHFDPWYRTAELSCKVYVAGTVSGSRAEVTLTDPNGKAVASVTEAVCDGCAECILNVEKPKLWWPKNYGSHPLYTVTARLFAADGTQADLDCKTVGLRKIEKTGDMRFRINGLEIKQWGALLEPFNGLTHRWDAQKCAEMMALCDHANINTLRIWGGGMQFGETLYDEADRRGILLWQEFFNNWLYMPDSEEYCAQYRAEAEYTVKRVKHRASVLLYCGGNECVDAMISATNRQCAVGYRIFEREFAEPCRRLDPERYYHMSSPCGGDYPSDPREGDSHPLSYTIRHAVAKYPLFLSEQARSTTGPYRSLRRFFTEEELWPEGYVNQTTYSQYNPAYNISHPERPFYQLDPDYEKKYTGSWIFPRVNLKEPFQVTSWKKVGIPDSWWRRAASFFASECGPLERFYDAENVEELIYRINAATACFFREDLERVRRGKPYHAAQEARRCQGYFYVKLNDTWPQLYCSLIDYFGELYLPYYQFRRSLSPVLLSFEFDDQIFLWGVNDTAERVHGELTVRVFSQIRNRVVREECVPVSLQPGESGILMSLAHLCPIETECVLHAVLTGENGEILSAADSLMDIERHQTFPQAKLTLTCEEDGCLVISADHYAHCVELSGDEAGDAFGWQFEDNYFNLLPYEVKRVSVFGKHRKGTIRAKAHFSPYTTSVAYEKKQTAKDTNLL